MLDALANVISQRRAKRVQRRLAATHAAQAMAQLFLADLAVSIGVKSSKESITLALGDGAPKRRPRRRGDRVACHA